MFFIMDIIQRMVTLQFWNLKVESKLKYSCFRFETSFDRL